MLIRHALDGIKPGTFEHAMITEIEKNGFHSILVLLSTFCDEQAAFALGDKSDVRQWTSFGNRLQRLAVDAVEAAAD